MFGLVPDKKKAKFHKNLVKALLGIYEAVDGIDLAVLDGAYFYKSFVTARLQRGKARNTESK
jgi:hypothetical protein